MNNPFTNFNELEEMNEIIQKYLTKLNNDITLSEKEEKDFIEHKKKITNIMLRLTEENYLLNQIKNTDDIIIKSRKKAYKMLMGFMAGGFLIGLIPVPFADIPLSFGLYAGMIVKIGHCYFFSFQEIPIMDFIKLLFGFDSRISKALDNDESMKPMEICHKTIDTVRVLGNIFGNRIGNTIGNKFGQNLAMNIGAKKAANWAARGLHFVPKGMGRQIFRQEIKEVVVKESFQFNKIMEILMQLFPSMKKGAEEGVEQAAKSLGKSVGNTYYQNTIHFAGEQLQKMCESRAKDYAAKITKESSKYLKTFSTFSKVMPIIGSIIGGVLDCWGTYSVGNNAINYFEDYITKSLGCDYVIRQKNAYFQIFEDLDYASNENYEQFDYNLYELDNCDYLDYA